MPETCWERIDNKRLNCCILLVFSISLHDKVKSYPRIQIMFLPECNVAGCYNQFTKCSFGDQIMSFRVQFLHRPFSNEPPRNYAHSDMCVSCVYVFHFLVGVTSLFLVLVARFKTQWSPNLIFKIRCFTPVFLWGCCTFKESLGHPDYVGDSVVRITRESGTPRGKLHAVSNVQNHHP